MMGASYCGGGISEESFGVDGFVRRFSLDAQSFVTFGLAFCAAAAHIRSPRVPRSVRVAATLPFRPVGLCSFRVPVGIRLVLRSHIRFAGRLAASNGAGSFPLFAPALLWKVFT